MKTGDGEGLGMVLYLELPTVTVLHIIVLQVFEHN